MKKTNTKISKRYKTGCKMLDSIGIDGAARIVKLLKDISPDMAKFTIEFPYGDIFSRPGLNLKTRELITIASLVTLGHAPMQLRAHIKNALGVGCSKEEIVETIIQMSVYAGFPSCLNGLLIAKEVFKKKRR